MADKVESPADRRKAAWSKAEKDIAKGKPEGALLTLREADSSGEYATTLQIAGEATWKIAQRDNSKSDYRKAASLLRDSVQKNPKNKQANTLYNDLLNEMQDKRIKESVIPRFVNDGTPTAAGAFAFVTALILVLAGLSILSQPRADGDVAVFEMSWTNADGSQESGSVTIELYPDEAPKHVANFKALIADGNYDDTIYHRIIQGFMLQGGDFTNSDGTGGHAVVWSGYCNGQASSSSTDCPQTSWTVEDEADNGLKHEPYVLSMAKTGQPHTGGSQFFIVSPGSTPSHLDGVHTVFGKVTAGQDVVDKIDAVQTGGGSNSDPVYTVSLDSASLSGGSEDPWFKFW